jgi:N-acetylglucosamine-6-phosphate deacetylase
MPFGANFLGLHLEGPYLNPQFAGAHPAQFLLNRCETDLYKECLSLECLSLVKMVTLAPELPNALELIEWLTNRGVEVACGHSGATVLEMELAKERGVKLVTHLFNAMAPFHHRNPGIIGYTLGAKALNYSLITDGVHLAKEAIELAYNAHPSGMMLVSDASALLGSASGTLAGQILDPSGVLSQKNTIAGSSFSLFDCMKKLVACTGSLTAAVNAASTRPAHFLHLQDRKGKIAVGYDADLIIFTENLELQACYVAGACAFRDETL